MAATVRSNIVQISNISPAATSEQLRTLFGHIGVLEEFIIYPTDDKEEPASKVAYIRYQDPINAEVALHLNNTVFLDRALIVLPLANGLDSIPDEKYANLIRAPAHTAAGVLPRTSDWPMDVISMVVGRPGEQVIHTVEPRLSTLAFPLYPPLPATTDGSRIEEIRRTILVTNLDPKTTGDQVLDFFNSHAEVRCVRMAGTEFDRAAYVEFTHQPSIIKAFGLMGATLNGRLIMVQHSNCAIIKPANNMALFDDGSKAAPLANSTRSVDNRKYRERSKSRSRSRDRRSRSPRRSGSRRKRSRSRDRRRSYSRHSRRRSRTRSRSHGRRRRSRSYIRDHRRSGRGRSRSRERRRYRRSRSRSDRRRSSRSRSRARRPDRRDRDRDREFERRSKDPNRDRERRDRDHDKDRRVDRDKDHSKGSKSRHRHNGSPVGEDSRQCTQEEKIETSSVATPNRFVCENTHPASHRSHRTSSQSSYGDSSDGDNNATKSSSKPSSKHSNGTSNEIAPVTQDSNGSTEQPTELNNSCGTTPTNGSTHQEIISSPTRSDSGDAMDTEA